MIRAHCSKCGKRVKAPDEGAGKQIACPRCGQAIKLPDEPNSTEPFVAPKTISPAVPVAVPAAVPAAVPVVKQTLPEKVPAKVPEKLPEKVPAVPVRPAVAPAALPAAGPPALPPVVNVPELPLEPLPPANVGESITYVTQDPTWVSKVIVGGLIISMPLMEPVTDGFQMRTLRQIQRGRKNPMPRWNDLGGLFLEGIKLRGAIWCMYIPAVMLAIFTVIVDISWIAQFFISDEATQDNISTFRSISRWVLIPLLNLMVLIIQTILFLTVPTMVLRAVNGESFFRLLNPWPSLRLIQWNLTLYLFARLAIFVTLFIFSIIAGGVSGVGWVILVGPVVGWLILGIGRFWTRLVWAYYLARMRPPGGPATDVPIAEVPAPAVSVVEFS